MSPIKPLHILFISAVLLTACSPKDQAQQSAPVTSAPTTNNSTNRELSEESAVKILTTELKKHNVPDLECLSLVSENENTADSKATTWNFAAQEIHDEKCGGDPAVSHTRDRYRVDSNGNVTVYDVVNDEYKAIGEVEAIGK